MALADTIHDLLAQQKIRSTTNSGKDALLADWQRDISNVLTQIQATLQPFIDDGSTAIDWGAIEIEEDLLGTYEAPQLAFTIANRRIVAAPVARMTLGGTGRIDLYRADRPSERERFLIVREAGDADPASLPWLIENKDEVPPDALLALRSIRRSGRRFYPLSQAVIESAIDYLLKMP